MRSLKLVAKLIGMTLFLTGCGQETPAPTTTGSKSLAIIEYGPNQTTAGQPFNVQPDGRSAIWARTENATPTTVLVMKETVLESPFVQADGKLVTAGVPKALYEQPGEYPVFLLDQQTQEKSNEVKFVVK
jgi:hypothetical protein